MARLLLGFPRALSFEVSIICYGPDDAMLVPTLVHSKLDSLALPDVELVLATIEHFLSVPCEPAVSKQRTPRPAPQPTVARLRLSPRLAPAARQEAGPVRAHRPVTARHAGVQRPEPPARAPRRPHSARAPAGGREHGGVAAGRRVYQCRASEPPKTAGHEGGGGVSLFATGACADAALVAAAERGVCPLGRDAAAAARAGQDDACVLDRADDQRQVALTVAAKTKTGAGQGQDARGGDRAGGEKGGCGGKTRGKPAPCQGQEQAGLSRKGKEQEAAERLVAAYGRVGPRRHGGARRRACKPTQPRTDGGERGGVYWKPKGAAAGRAGPNTPTDGGGACGGEVAALARGDSGGALALQPLAPCGGRALGVSGKSGGALAMEPLAPCGQGPSVLARKRRESSRRVGEEGAGGGGEEQARARWRRREDAVMTLQRACRSALVRHRCVKPHIYLRNTSA